ncbi:MAG: hypothetical protein FJW23_15835 [Acidimicrobiia bacterium]|nr:hypothetical protein [Acidimicrobiia bacterium]
MDGKGPKFPRGAVILGLLVLVAGAAHAAPRQAGAYVVGPQDVLTISVFDQPNLGGKYTVEADGTFSFPLIRQVHVAGLTLREVETLLQGKLADGFFKNPQVSVTVEQYRSQRVFIVGQVRDPGTYALTGDMTLIEALARAGSVTDSASGELLILRPKTGTASGPVTSDQDESADVIRIDLMALQTGQLSQNALLRDGDTIFVPRAELVYVFGQVRSPGSFTLQKGMTVLQALSLAGGLTDRGAANRIRIVRTRDGLKSEVKADMDDPVQPDDTIIVPERFF